MSEPAAPANVRPTHRFRVGQRVTFAGGAIYGMAGSSTFTVTRLMPPVGGVFGYRIKGDADTYERSADERQLSAAFL